MKTVADISRTGLPASFSGNCILIRQTSLHGTRTLQSQGDSEASGSNSTSLGTISHDVHALQIDTAAEVTARVAKAREEKSKKCQQAPVSHEDVNALLKIGTVTEVTERAAKAREEKSKKGQWARDAYEALGIVARGGYKKMDGVTWCSISSLVCNAVAGSVHYGADQWTPGTLSKPLFPEGAMLEVQNGTTLAGMERLEAAKDRGTVGVLNFASARNPGGGFTTGAAAQEETLARSSALYPCLTRYFTEFFLPSRRAESGSYTHDIIYSPGVPFFRDDAGRLLENPCFADIVTAAAPNVGSMTRTEPGEDPENILRERIPRVLDVFARHAVTDLVLGAWGCGVFGNSPAVVAKIFAEELQGRFHGQFRRILFAVLDTSMAQVFASTFQTEMLPPESEGSQWGAARNWGGKGNCVENMVQDRTSRPPKQSKKKVQSCK